MIEKDLVGGGATVAVSPVDALPADALDQIRIFHKHRKRLIRSRVSEQNRCWGQIVQIAMGRGMDFAEAKKFADRNLGSAIAGKLDDQEIAKAVSPWRQAIAIFAAEEPWFKKRMEKLAKEMPAAEWVAGVRGFGMTNYACILGETGDLRNYPNPAKVWKRLSVGLVGDERQRRIKDNKELAIIHGYKPEVASIVWQLGECLVRQNKGGEYRRLYDEYKARQKAEHPELTDGHINNRARRYAAKAALRDLWCEWNR